MHNGYTSANFKVVLTNSRVNSQSLQKDGICNQNKCLSIIMNHCKLTHLEAGLV